MSKVPSFSNRATRFLYAEGFHDRHPCDLAGLRAARLLVRDFAGSTFSTTHTVGPLKLRLRLMRGVRARVAGRLVRCEAMSRNSSFPLPMISGAQECRQSAAL